MQWCSIPRLLRSGHYSQAWKRQGTGIIRRTQNVLWRGPPKWSCDLQQRTESTHREPTGTSSQTPDLLLALSLTNPTTETGKGRLLTESTPNVTGNNGKGKSENGSGAWYVITSKRQAPSQLNTFHRQFPDQSKYSGSQRKNEHVKEMAGSFWFTLHKTFAVWDQILIPGKSLGGFP